MGALGRPAPPERLAVRRNSAEPSDSAPPCGDQPQPASAERPRGCGRRSPLSRREKRRHTTRRKRRGAVRAFRGHTSPLAFVAGWRTGMGAGCRRRCAGRSRESPSAGRCTSRRSRGRSYEGTESRRSKQCWVPLESVRRSRVRQAPQPEPFARGGGARAAGPRASPVHARRPVHRTGLRFSGAEGIRTPGLFVANEARYQLRHSPELVVWFPWRPRNSNTAMVAG